MAPQPRLMARYQFLCLTLTPPISPLTGARGPTPTSPSYRRNIFYHSKPFPLPFVRVSSRWPVIHVSPNCSLLTIPMLIILLLCSPMPLVCQIHIFHHSFALEDPFRWLRCVIRSALNKRPRRLTLVHPPPAPKPRNCVV